MGSMSMMNQTTYEMKVTVEQEGDLYRVKVFMPNYGRLTPFIRVSPWSNSPEMALAHLPNMIGHLYQPRAEAPDFDDDGDLNY